MKNYTSQEIKEFVSKPLFDEKVILNKDPSWPKISIVTPIHNGLNETIAFLESIKKVDYPNFEIVIIDDGSNDGSWEFISSNYPEIRLLKGDGNLWWAAATNIGVKDAISRGADYILTINNDVEVSPDFLRKLVVFAEKNPNVLVGSVVYYFEKPEKIWYAGGRINWLFGIFRHYKNINARKIEWLSGMGALVHRNVFKKIGFYNEKKCPHYMADMEFTLRAKRSGYKLCIVPDSKIWNKTNICGGISMLRSAKIVDILRQPFLIKSEFYLKARWYIYVKYFPIIFLFTANIGYFVSFLIKVLLVKIKKI